MNRLLLYNPENDIALASGLERFTPPAVGRVMARAGALLPFWWADDDSDEVLLPPDLTNAALELKSRYGLPGQPGFSCATEAAPWGWSAYTRRLLITAGMPENRLPDPALISRLRDLSHRRVTIAIHRALGTDPSLIPVEATTPEEAIAAIGRFGNAVVKQPWSCSGRGVFFTRGLSADELRRRTEAAIRRQGSLLIEPEYEREQEMAALFYSDGRSMAFRGMSAFTADDRGAYTGNVVAPQKELEQLCGADAVVAARRLAPVLQDIIGSSYRGWMGVDMLRHADGLNPCMELNLRMTMGVVAMMLADRLPRGRVAVTHGDLPPGAIDLSPTGAPLRIIHTAE